MNGRASWLMLLLSMVLSGVALHLYVCLLPSVCTQGLWNPSTMSYEPVKSKRPAGADVPVKQVELAPATHQLSVLIKMEIVNICGELICTSDLSVPFIWVPSLKEMELCFRQMLFPGVLFIVHMLHMAPLIKKSSSEGMWLCLSGSFSCLKLERYAAYLSGEIHPSAEATVQMKNNPTCLFFSYSLQSKLEIRWKLLRGSTAERFPR